MSAKKIILAVVVAVVAVGAIFLVLPKDNEAGSGQPAQTATSPADEEATSQPTQEERAKTYTAAQVYEHNSEDDCWTIINNSVYDLTSFISQHPGGDEILRACGTDGTTLFTQRETANGEEVGSGTPHSSSAQQQLERLKIGTLAD